MTFIHVNVGELRQAGGGTTDLDGKSCAIHLVADYKYYQMVGRGSETRTLALMVTANYIFSPFLWYS